ncbi:DNA replication factor Dna2-domain-containing protein [Mycena floridula]|nr:DNA replication factor Dna2-domain-containing protein [Mycena floridula]
MQPIIPTQKEQDEFMNGLLADLDESFWNDPTPTTSPVKQKATPRTPCKHKTQTFNTDVDMSALLEGSENWDLDMDTFELSPRKTTGQTIINPARRPRPETVATRCIVQSVVRSEGQLDLTAKLDPGSEIRAIILRDDWARTDIRIGDTINVIGEFSLQSPSSSSVTLSIPITSKSNLLILHPDHLLTATALSNAPQCLRKPLLSALVRSSSDVTPALVWGNILHTVVQSCLTEGRWDEQWIDDQIDTAAREGMGELAKVGFDVEQGKREIKGRAKGLQPFGERYISDKPKASKTPRRCYVLLLTTSLSRQHF